MVHIENGRDHFWQWDLDQRLIVDNPTVKEVHFCNAMSESALVCEVREENGVRYVNVPNILLQSALCISAYSHCDGYTVVNQRFNVIERTRPDDYVYTETQVMRWQDLEQRVKDGIGYYVPNVDADGNLSWTSDNPLLPSVETVNVKGTKGDPGEVTESQLAAAIAPLNVAGSVQAKRISNLEAAAQGVLYREETDTSEAYSKDVPAGAMPWASLDKVGGKTVVWNQLFRKVNATAPSNGLNVEYLQDGSVRMYTDAGGITQDTIVYIMFLSAADALPAERKFLITAADNGSSSKYRSSIFDSTGNRLSDIYSSAGIFSISKGISRYGFVAFAGWTDAVGVAFKPQIFDMTAMFGAGNEPTSIDDPRIAFIKAYAEQHPEYNAGELLSAEVVEVELKGKNLQIVDTFLIPDEVREMCPGYGWSAGTVCNEIDFERKVYVQRVNRYTFTGNESGRFYPSVSAINQYSLELPIAAVAQQDGVHIVCNKYIGSYYTNVWFRDKNVSLLTDGTHAYFVDSAFNSLDEAREYVRNNEVTVCYELSEPIEVDLSDVLSDDHFIEVEAGGTITFKQASTQLPVPSAVTYQVSTKEAIANA